MAGIKIINVLKNDSFEEVLSEFKKTDAEEVIFVLPSHCQAVKPEENLTILAQIAQDSGKVITLMTADPRADQWVKQYNFRFLSSSTSPASPKNIFLEGNQVPDLLYSPEEEERKQEPEKETGAIATDELLAELTLARRPTAAKEIKDIRMVAKKPNPLKVETKKTDIFSPPLKRKDAEKTTDKIQGLDRIWLRERSPRAFFQRSSDKRSGRTDGKTYFPGPALKKVYGWGGGGLILVVLAFLYFTLGSAEIIIYPKKQILDFKIPVAVDINAPVVNIDAGEIPGKLIAIQAEASADFPATGEKEVANKARGKITIFNNFNSEVQTFVATTRFESSAGLIFRTPRIINIPGAKLVNGELVPGSIEVEVIADKPGEEYNIGSDRFTIPGLQGSPRYEGFYAQSAAEMRGGKIGLAKVITEKDFADAKTATGQQALKQAEEKIQREQQDWETAGKAQIEVISLQSTAEADEAMAGLTMKAQAQARNIVFAKQDLLALLESFINKKDQGELILLIEQLRLAYQEVKLNLKENLLTFVLEVKGEAAAKINEEKIITSMKGMRQEKIKDYLLSINEIESAKVTLSPFWVRRVPLETKDIDLRIIYVRSP